MMVKSGERGDLGPNVSKSGYSSVIICIRRKRENYATFFSDL